MEYYYEIIDLFRLVDSVMQEHITLDYLFRGMKPGLLGKISVLNSRACAGWLQFIKLHSEASEMANQAEWSVANLGADRQKKAVGLAEKTIVKEDAQSEDLLKVLMELIKQKRAELEEMKVRASSRSGGRRRPPGNRTLDGIPICFKCRKSGHSCRYCLE